ncbi:MAG TPA: hypothetical protein PLY70_05935 [Saprospiraceae bacterium]|nr:hypothetical protein [Saprospiraceae bacterium]HPN69179.1 hypothetical protein [Saprospiraceae bacterium]
MKKIKILIALALIIPFVSHAQTNFEIEWTQSAIFLDQFGESSRRDGINGYGMQSEVLIWRKFENIGRISPRLGSGYTNLWYLNSSLSPRMVASYLPVKFGFDFNFKKKSIKLMANLSNYICLNAKSNRSYYQDNTPFVERSIYANIDLGIRIKTGKRSTFNLSTPITIFPIITSGLKGDFLPIVKPDYKVWAETIGLNLGFKWTLGEID